MNKRTIIRKAKNKDNPYVMIAKTAVQDDGLSWKATGLLSYILSLPDDWQIYLTELTKHKRDGKQSTRSALKELIDRGYIAKCVKRDSKGKFLRFEYTVHEVPNLSIYPKAENGLMDTTNKDLTNKDEQDYIIQEKRRRLQEHWDEMEFNELMGNKRVH